MQEVTRDSVNETLELLDEKLSEDFTTFFTISYDFGKKLLKIDSPNAATDKQSEPDFFYAQFDVVVVHDYDTGVTYLTGNADKFDVMRGKLRKNIRDLKLEISNETSTVTSNFTKSEYLAAIENIKESIRRGYTYQTNLTQQLTAILPDELTPEIIFARLHRDHPAPFSAFIKRLDSTVVSASPERFFRIGERTSRRGEPAKLKGTPLLPRGLVHSDSFRRQITTSPIKGTRPRGHTVAEDAALLQELLESPKDRAENTMIVDLLRNDLGRVCEYGSVRVEKLCDLEQHPTFFHLVSTVSGILREKLEPSDILRAVFPCGSITGTPKISTMRIIDSIEPVNRGLSMGAIGYYIPGRDFGSLDSTLDLSVAIRTMVIRDQVATFNVGGGIVIDSDPQSEYDETLTKAKALLAAIDARFGN
jgi:para-aminobenzoate synthetase component 1